MSVTRAEGQVQIGSEFGDRVVFPLQLACPGRIAATASWTGSTESLALILNGPERPELANPVAYYVRKDGQSPLTIEYYVTSTDVQRGSRWQVSLVNLSGSPAGGDGDITQDGAAAGQVEIDFPGKCPEHIAGMGIAGSDDHVYVWYKDGTTSSGTSWDLGQFRDVYAYSLPPGKSPGDIVGMGIAGSNDYVYTWYRDGTVSAGTSWDLDQYRDPYAYSLAPGKSPEDIAGMGIAGSNDYVYTWYRDGSVSAGTSWDLDEHRARYSYSLPPGMLPEDIVAMAIAGSNDYVYVWYKGGLVSAGTSSDLDEYRSLYLYFLP
jgi:hypothetical protein